MISKKGDGVKNTKHWAALNRNKSAKIDFKALLYMATDIHPRIGPI